MPDKTKFEREIDEILEKSEGEMKPRPSRKRKFEPFSPTVPKRKSAQRAGPIRFNPGSVMIPGLVILAIAAFSPVGKLPLAIVGALMVTVSYIWWFRKGGSSGFSGRAPRGGTSNRSDRGPGGDEPQVKYWRGRRIEEKPDPADPGGSGDSDDRGKIIDFRPFVDDPDPSDDDQGDK